jgi:hypothetical protein
MERPSRGGRRAARRAPAPLGPQPTPARPARRRPAGAAAALAEEGRQWLKDAQAYVLHVQAQAGALAAARGSGVGDAWAFLVQDAARALARVGRQMAAGGKEGAAVSYGAVPPRGRRLITGAVQPYAAYWAKAVAI